MRNHVHRFQNQRLMCVGGPRVPAPTWWRFVWTHSTELILTPVATLLQRKETGRIGGGDRRVGEGPSKPEETFKAPLPTDDGIGVGHPMWNIIIPLGRLRRLSAQGFYLADAGASQGAWWASLWSDRSGFHALSFMHLSVLFNRFQQSDSIILFMSFAKKIKVRRSKISLCPNCRQLVSVQIHFPLLIGSRYKT